MGLTMEGKILTIKYPIFGIDWQRDRRGQPLVAIAGGGGAAKSGIKNCMTLARVPPPVDATSKPLLDVVMEIDTGEQLISGVAIGSKDELLALTMGNKTAVYRVTDGPKGKAIFVTDFQTDFAKEDSYQNVVKFSPDGTQLATGGEDGIVRIWTLTIPSTDENEDDEDGDQADLDDAAYRKAFRVSAPIVLEGHNGCINGLSWHAMGNKLLSCAKDGQCILWSQTKKPPYTWKKAATLGLAGELALQKEDKATNRGKFVYRGCQFEVADDDDASIVTLQTPARGSSYLTKWSVDVDKNGKAVVEELSSVRLKDTIICSIAISDKYIACGSSDGQVLVYRFETLTHVKTTTAHYLPSTGIAFFPPLSSDSSEDADTSNGLEFADDITFISASADYSLYLVSGMQPSRVIYFLIFLAIFLYLAVFAYLGEQSR
ncbi:Aste57867_8575 [Aphanomyces stellatus]|uniref:Aste57867_8575 protein n=1 Tax=Aphanomyces stellatus TaxID=120398 RepID=A0A485KKL2_9STRA|nr:hypothetical protein As57867_008543 [Aphanomyces stellatus]VFT85461.1 Aste57867_8575 [Aphanomyces stellatus]